MTRLKKMKKVFILLGIFTIIWVSSLSGCLDEKSKFVGTWQSSSISMTFDSNNKVTITGSGLLGVASLTGTFNYSIANQKITFSSGDFGRTFNYSFPESNQLIISDESGASLLLTKK